MKSRVGLLLSVTRCQAPAPSCCVLWLSPSGMPVGRLGYGAFCLLPSSVSCLPHLVLLDRLFRWTADAVISPSVHGGLWPGLGSLFRQAGFKLLLFASSHAWKSESTIFLGRAALLILPVGAFRLSVAFSSTTVSGSRICLAARPSRILIKSNRDQAW